MDEVVQARFVKEARSDGRQSYSIRFFDPKGNLSMRANFTKIYDSNGNLVKEKVAKFDEMYTKYGSKELLSLKWVDYKKWDLEWIKYALGEEIDYCLSSLFY